MSLFSRASGGEKKLRKEEEGPPALSCVQSPTLLALPSELVPFLIFILQHHLREGEGAEEKNNAKSVKLKIMRWVGKATAGTYNVSVFGEGLGAGHHGGGPVLQLAQFLPSLVQSYPSTGEFPYDARRRSLHALHAPRAGDVLGQAPGGLPGSCFTDCAKDIKQISESEKKSELEKIRRRNKTKAVLHSQRSSLSRD